MGIEQMLTTGVVPRARDRARNHLSRRRRVPHRVPCRLRVLDEAAEPIASYCGQTVNISACGLAVQVSQPIPAGTQIEALVPHADGAPLLFSGKVLHIRRVLGDVFEIGISGSPTQEWHAS